MHYVTLAMTLNLQGVTLTQKMNCDPVTLGDADLASLEHSVINPNMVKTSIGYRNK
jgi:hypothetical protein